MFFSIVIVDEAYIDFSNLPSFAPQVTKFPNVIVLQTMSKSFGLAGVRYAIFSLFTAALTAVVYSVGVAFAPVQIIEVLNRLKSPYNLGKPAVAIGTRPLFPPFFPFSRR